MSRININEFSAQAGGLAFRANQVRTDPAVVKAAQDAWSDVKDASRSCSVLARESQGRVAPLAHRGPGYRRAPRRPHPEPDPGPSHGRRLVATPTLGPHLTG